MTWFLIFLAMLAVVIWKMMGKSSSKQAPTLPDYERGKPSDLEGMSRNNQDFVYTFERQPRADRSAAKFERLKSDPPKPQARSAPPPPPREAPQMGRPTSPPSRGRWIASGETIEVAGFRYAGGMVYFGKVLEAPRGGGVDNSLIDPSLKVAAYSPDRAGHTMHYWPSYSQIRPEARRAYLEWLAGGRKDPEVGIGYVFLFFYGLERRLFVERVREDFPAIAAEVRRLVAFAGQRWRVTGVDDRSNVLEVEIHRSAKVPKFDGKANEPLHDRLLAEMFEVYRSGDVPAFLDPAAKAMLTEGREAFEEYGLAEMRFVASGRDVHVLLWRGTEFCAVFSIALQSAGLEVEVNDLGVTVANATVEEVRAVVADLAGMPPIPAGDLAAFVENLRTAKYDEFVPEALLRRFWAKNHEAAAATVSQVASDLIGRGA